MTALTVVEDLHVFEQACARLFTGAVVAMHHELGLERMEEAFHRRVIPTVGPAAHALTNTVAREQCAISAHRVSSALVRMYDLGRNAAAIKRHVDGVHHKLAVQALAHRPTHD